MLKILASIYDPLGLATPVLIPAKVIFQETCRLRLQWDDPLPTLLLKEFKKWMKNITSLENYEQPRCLKLNNTGTGIELHTFCDGSELAYGTVSYVRINYPDGSLSTSLVGSKTRLTPLNNSTIKTVPRIELSSAKLAVECTQKLLSELEYTIEKVFYWTDSVTVLRYVKNESKRFHRFVSNKIAFIRNFSSPEQWLYVPSKNNPADISSRGATPAALMTSDLWNKGPEYLYNNSCEIPSQTYDTKIPMHDNEVKVETKTLATTTEELLPLDVLMTSSSSWIGLKVKIAWLLRFTIFLRENIQSNAPLSATELRNAEK